MCNWDCWPGHLDTDEDGTVGRSSSRTAVREQPAGGRSQEVLRQWRQERVLPVGGRRPGFA